MTAKPHDIDYRYNLAGQHYEAGRLDEAARIYAGILQDNPRHAETMYMLGLIFMRAQHFDKADMLFNGALEAQPAQAALFYKSMGDSSRMQGKMDEATRHYESAIERKADFAEAINNLASIYLMQRNFAKAEEYYKRILALRPGHPSALYNMGMIYKNTDRVSEALVVFQDVVKQKPEHADAWAEIGDIRKQSGDVDGAIDAYGHSLRLKPDAKLHTIFAALLSRQGQHVDAINHFKAALAIDENNIDALSSLGALFATFSKFEEAEHYCERARLLQPDNPETLNNLANIYKAYGDLDKAVFYYRQGIDKDPGDSRIYANLMLAMIYSANVAPEEIAQTAFQFGEIVAQSPARKFPLKNNRDPDRVLRIGYVSPDFRKHSVNYFFEHVLKNHDRTKFEIFGYSNTMDEDDVTRRLQSGFDQWRVIRGINNDDAAALINDDRIDILVDMAGHTANNRLLVFARRPAPLQVSWLGYPATTGLKEMDYRITDSYAEPEGMTEALNIEKLWRLPHIFCCFDPQDKMVDVIDHPPFEDNGYITFGCFNTFTKVTDPVLTAWKRIMDRVPGSKLLLEIVGIDTHVSFRENVLRRLALVGFTPEQIILEPRRPENQFVLYNRIDIALDPFPCNGGTTSMDTMWMGVPLIALAGRHFVSRMGVTILSNAGLQELIAEDISGYVDKAVQLANDGARLKSLRTGLRERIKDSPLMDQKLFARDIEDAYRGMWRRWCEDKK